MLSSAGVGSQEGCEVAIEMGASLGSRGKKGRTVLMVAIRKKHMELAQWLAAKMTPSQLSDLDSDGMSALDYAVANEDVAMARLLASMGADVEAPNPDCGVTTLMEAARIRSGEMIKALLDLGANPRAKDGVGDSALCFAVCNGNVAAVELLAPISDLSGHPTSGTPLMMACRDGHVDVVRLLANAESCAQIGPDGVAALSIALARDWRDLAGVVGILLPYSDVWAKDKEGRSPLELLAGVRRADSAAVERVAVALADAMMSSARPETEKLVELCLAVGLARGIGNTGVLQALQPRLDSCQQRMLLLETIASAPGDAPSPGKPRI